MGSFHRKVAFLYISRTASLSLSYLAGPCKVEGYVQYVTMAVDMLNTGSYICKFLMWLPMYICAPLMYICAPNSFVFEVIQNV